MKACCFCLLIAAVLLCGTKQALAADTEYIEAAAPVAAETAESEKPGVFATFAKRLTDTWHSDHYDLYVPFYDWHNRFTYDSVTKYNERPWGGGFGRSIKDEDGDFHGLYAMGFMDSNNRFQPMIGYAYVKNFYMDEARDFSLGLGYTLGLTARHEYDYIPLPLALPVISLAYKDFAVEAAYVPGGKNDGNVLFCWMRWHF